MGVYSLLYPKNELVHALIIFEGVFHLDSLHHILWPWRGYKAVTPRVLVGISIQLVTSLATLHACCFLK